MVETTSPIPPKTNQKADQSIQMSFPDAMKKAIEGKKIHRIEWENKDYYGFLNGEFLSLHKPDGKNYKWIINDGDLNGTDYIVL